MILDDGNKETLQCVSILVVMACIVQVHKKKRFVFLGKCSRGPVAQAPLPR